MSAKDCQDVQVVIVGAGPTGLAAANLLGSYGIETLLLERNTELSTQPRAVSIDDEGLRICQALGLGTELMEEMLLDLQVEYRSGKRILAHIAPRSRPNAHPPISTLRQPVLEAGLLAGLKRFPCVRTCFGYTLETFAQTTSGVTLTMRTPEGQMTQVSCAYLLACDGGKSAIRQQLGIALKTVPALPLVPGSQEEHAQERWLVIDSTEIGIDRKTILFFCNPARPAVTVPTPEETRRWEFMLFPGEHDEHLLTSASIQGLIHQTCTQSGIALTEDWSTFRVLRRASYTFASLLATSLRENRIFLLGDAAHLMPPFGGQGLSSGLRDAYNLCWKLAYVLKTSSAFELLESYPQERSKHAIDMIRLSSLLGQVIMPTQRPLAEARDLFFAIVNCLPPVVQLLNEMRVKPAPRYTSLLRGTTSQHKAARALIGTLLPQVRVLTASNEQCMLDDILGNRFALLRIYEEHATLKGDWLGIPTPLDPPASQKQPLSVTQLTLLDQEGTLSSIARRASCAWLLLRPDHFIMDLLYESGESKRP